jgi:hypothetical protein
MNYNNVAMSLKSCASNVGFSMLDKMIDVVKCNRLSNLLLVKYTKPFVQMKPFTNLNHLYPCKMEIDQILCLINKDFDNITCQK